MQVILKRHKDKFLRRGYPWVFRNLIHRTVADLKRGDVVEVISADGLAFGRGLYHDTSQIAVRFLTRNTEEAVDDNFFRQRVRRAVEFRESVYGNESHRRLIFGESDGIPGTIVDQYQDVLTWTCLSYGMEQRREIILDELKAILSPRLIVERNDAELRTKDELEVRKGIIYGGGEPTAIVNENGVEYQVDVLNGPKTGFFIDQRWNRAVVRGFAKGRRVLDAFSGDGGFGLQAAAAGAESVLLLDASESSLSRARTNAERNGLQSRISTRQEDSLDALGRIVGDGEKYDLVILDPPAFAKSRRNLEEATRAYQRINITGLQLLGEGGILATGSCSQAMGRDDFLRIVNYASRKTGRPLRLLFRGSISADHPVLASMPETDYLKFFIFQICGTEVPYVNERGSDETVQ